MIFVDKVRDLIVDDGGSDPRRVVAASSLVRLRHTLCVVADDALSLAVFPQEGRRPGYSLEILPSGGRGAPGGGDKPDLEACVLMPPGAGCAQGSILILGSGSNENRDTGALVPLEDEDRPSAEHRRIDLRPLFNGMRKEIFGLNIEGAAVQGDSLYLLQRGDMAGSKDALIRLDLTEVLGNIEDRQEIGAATIEDVRIYDLGHLAGVPLTFSDLSPLEDGRMVFSASAEGGSEHGDGAIAGSALGIFDVSGGIALLEPVDLQTKIEGSTARATTEGIEVLMVVDDDDPDSPTPLLRSVLPTYP